MPAEPVVLLVNLRLLSIAMTSGYTSKHSIKIGRIIHYGFINFVYNLHSIEANYRG